MNDPKLSAADAENLWGEAARRLRLIDVEPPLSLAQIEALLNRLGPRRSGETLHDWLQRSQTRSAAPTQTSAEIIPFNPRRQRFVPLGEIVRLAADSGGTDIALPDREIETGDGRFRLAVTRDEDQLVITLQALGLASDEFAGKLIGLAMAESSLPPAVVLRLDGDGDGEARLPDTTELRQALLRPVIGVIEDA